MRRFFPQQYFIAGSIFLLFLLSAPVSSSAKEYRVLYVIDGDTIIVNYNGAKEKVRFIGIDTPETPPDAPPEYCGPEAREFTKKALGGGYARLVFDRGKRDKYGRLLAYIYTRIPVKGNKGGAEMFLNEKLMERGLARLMTIPPNTAQAKRLAAAGKTAKQKKLGVWGKGSCR